MERLVAVLRQRHHELTARSGAPIHESRAHPVRAHAAHLEPFGRRLRRDREARA